MFLRTLGLSTARLAGLALAAGTVQVLNFAGSSSPNLAFTQQQQSDNSAAGAAATEEVDPAEKRFAAAFLDAEGKATLAGAVRVAHAEAVAAPHMTIAYSPKGANLARLATQLGRPVDLKVNAVVTDKHAQTAVVELVKATEDDDGGVPFMVENSVPHVTISIAAIGHDGYGPFYSNHLLSRAKAAAGALDKDWKGVLPARDGYEATECEITVPKERTVLTATLCVSDQWNGEANRCGEEKGCGFCRFMKLGPCGKQFAIWEACIDKCKETEEDFVDKCAQQTLTLKQCVDQNPEYYYSVLEEDENQEGEVSEAEVAPDAVPVTASGEMEPTAGEALTETEVKDLAEVVEEQKRGSEQEEEESKVTSQETDADLITIDGSALIEVSAAPATDDASAPLGEASSSTTELEEENYTTKG